MDFVVKQNKTKIVETYMIRVDLHVNSTNVSYIRCPTQGYPLNDEIQYENKLYHTINMEILY